MQTRSEWGSYEDWMLYQIDVEHMECIMMGRYWAVLHHSVMDAWDLLTDAETPEEARRKAAEAYAHFKGCKLPWREEEKTFQLMAWDKEEKPSSTFKKLSVRQSRKPHAKKISPQGHMYIRLGSCDYELNLTKNIRDAIGVGNKVNVFLDKTNKKIALQKDINGAVQLNTNGICNKRIINQIGINKSCYLYPCDAGEYDFCFDYSNPEYVSGDS